jgi:hypothetical protein
MATTQVTSVASASDPATGKPGRSRLRRTERMTGRFRAVANAVQIADYERPANDTTP